MEVVGSTCPVLTSFTLVEELRDPTEAQTRMLMSAEKDFSYFARLNIIRRRSCRRVLLPFNAFL